MPKTMGVPLPRLREYRKQRLWRQEDLAEKAGVAIRTVWAAEQGGNVKFGIIRKLAEALGVTPQELMDAM